MKYIWEESDILDMVNVSYLVAERPRTLTNRYRCYNIIKDEYGSLYLKNVDNGFVFPAMTVKELCSFLSPHYQQIYN